MQFLLTPVEPWPRAGLASEDDALEVVMTLRVYGDELDPAAVTAALGQQPRAAARKGEKFCSSDKIVAPTGTWFLEYPSVRLQAGQWFNQPNPPLSEGVARAVARLKAQIDLSVLFLGAPQRVKEDLVSHASEIAAFVTSEARCADVDIDVPNLGIDWVLARGQEVSADQLVAELGLAEPRPPLASD